LSTAVGDKFEQSTRYIHEKATRKLENTNERIEALRNEGHVREAVASRIHLTQVRVKEFGKKIWARNL
jgi:hypothetical protein